MLVYKYIHGHRYTDRGIFRYFFGPFPVSKKAIVTSKVTSEACHAGRMGKTQKLPACSSDDMEIMLSACKDIGLKPIIITLYVNIWGWIKLSTTLPYDWRHKDAFSNY